MPSSFRSFISVFLVSVLLVCCSQSGKEQTTGVAEPAGPADEVLYNRYCKGCHGKDGGLQLGGATDLRKSNLSEQETILMIAEGRGSMAAFKSMLTEDEIELLAEYVKGLRKN